jgi:hypothetical protein
VITAERVCFSREKAITLMQQMGEQTEQVSSQVSALLPMGFPQAISHAIFDGLSEQADKVKRAQFSK